jgi:voltage-gated potassium channel Kch
LLLAGFGDGAFGFGAVGDGGGDLLGGGVRRLLMRGVFRVFIVVYYLSVESVQRGRKSGGAKWFVLLEESACDYYGGSLSGVVIQEAIDEFFGNEKAGFTEADVGLRIGETVRHALCSVERKSTNPGSSLQTNICTVVARRWKPSVRAS